MARMAAEFAFVNLFCYLCIMKQLLLSLSLVLLVACMTACRATRTITITATSVSPATSDTTHISAGVVEDYNGVIQKKSL